MDSGITLVSLARLKGLDGLPDSIESIVFYLPMPESWSQKKQNEMRGHPHQSNIDLDNLCKAFLDALCSNDQHIHTIRNLQKVWSDFGQIVLEIDQGKEPEEIEYGSNVYKNL